VEKQRDSPHGKQEAERGREEESGDKLR
jgi:hypothetical protein